MKLPSIQRNVLHIDLIKHRSFSFKSSEYIQGQLTKKGAREYFYYIDHQGQLFLEGTKIKNFVTCFKDSEFLTFFFQQLRTNNTSRYVTDFPYVSRCGGEINFIYCENKPIVFTDIIKKDETFQLVINNIGTKMVFPFNPKALCMLPRNGRVYHPAVKKVGGVGILKTSLAIDFSSNFLFENGDSENDPPTHFIWQDTKYKLDNHLWELLKNENVADVE